MLSLSGTAARFILCTLFSTFLVTAYPQQVTINGPAGSERFGISVSVLTNGNYVVVDHFYDDGPLVNVGAVYLYNGATHTLISTLKGGSANSYVGSSGITVLNNGNFVVSSPAWTDGVLADLGAATWVNGSTGLNGVVSSANSLIGSSANDRVGNIITALPNGNYVVSSGSWDNGGITDAGAVTWADGTTGISGTISAANSLTSATSFSIVGNVGITVLSNGNYVVISTNWDDGAVTNVGAVTWCNGNTGRTGTISSANSLIGSTSGDMVGVSNITELPNGNYIVKSTFWDNGSFADAGAATWCNGTTGRTGVVSAANSLVGSSANEALGASIVVLNNSNYVVLSPSWDNGALTNVGAVAWCNGNSGATGALSAANALTGSVAGDQVGIHNVYALPNGNYVVASGNWNNGAITTAGAATWCNGTTGRTGTVSTANSLTGSTAGDNVGMNGVTVLSNGNYVVRSSNWDNGAISNAGAATWCNGTTGYSGAVSTANSLVGSTASDQVGSLVVALTNGNYVVISTSWDNGAISNAGAVTWCDGTMTTAAAVSTANSLVGSTAGDQVGSSSAQPLPNGNYIVRSVQWDNGAIANAGAITWCDGSMPTTGVVSAVNSVVGSSTTDQVGNNGISVLSNGNCVVRSPLWNNGALIDAGAVTWFSATAATTGPISAANSLVGSSANDQVGTLTYALPNGNYVVNTSLWNNGALADVGASTLCNGSTGTSGTISAANSLVGSTASDNAGNGTPFALSNGQYWMRSSNWDNGATINSGAVTIGYSSSPLTGTINSCNSVLGTLASNGNQLNPFYNSVYDYVIVSSNMENKIVIFNPLQGGLANSLDAVNLTLNGNNPVPFISSSGCRLIATVTPNGANPVRGNVTARVWIEPSVPSVLGQPFVARHYEITPDDNRTTATGRVTLYFTQAEFNAFNAHVGSQYDLPTGPADATGKSRMRIGKYSGTTNNGTGLPASYIESVTVLDPVDSDIVWNAQQARWEVSVDVTGFSGFVIQTDLFPLPLTLLDFSGRLQGEDGLLQWTTSNEQQCDHFELQRSTDGLTYQAIATVAARNTGGTHQYGYTDGGISALQAPVVYYRLKTVNTDGRFGYSGIVTLRPGNSDIVLLYPSPATTSLQLLTQLNTAAQLQVRIYDNAGRLVLQQALRAGAGSHSSDINISRLAGGPYYLQLTGPGIQETRRFVKQ